MTVIPNHRWPDLIREARARAPAPGEGSPEQIRGVAPDIYDDLRTARDTIDWAAMHIAADRRAPLRPTPRQRAWTVIAAATWILATIYAVTLWLPS